MMTHIRFEPRFIARMPHAAMAGVAAVLATLALMAGPLQAAIPSTTAHLYATRPVIAGQVVSVSEREMIVRTDQGEELTLLLDSRTVVPADLAPGMAMRTEFHVTDDGRFVAKRVTPLREGMDTNRELAYSRSDQSNGTEARFASTQAEEERAESDHPVVSRVTREDIGTVRSPVPGTTDYLLATKPMIVGTVESVNDHQVVVETDQGEHVTMVMDSRTMVPTDLDRGMPMRAEFKVMTDGQYYARRITPMRNGVEVEHPTAYQGDLENESTEHEVAAQTADYTAPPNGEVAENASNAEENGEREGSLPQTASRQPLIALLGGLALAGAVAVGFARRRFV